MRQTALAIGARPDAIDRFHQTGRAVHHDEQRLGQAAPHQVLQKTEPRIVRFPRSDVEQPSFETRWNPLITVTTFSVF
jgi:hypothetical protein